MKNHLLLLIPCLAFGACSTSYGPVGSSGGFTNYKMGPNVHRVVFSANGFTNTSECEKKALYRCAELALLDGCSYFEVLQGGTGVNTEVIFLPGQTTVNTNSYGHAYGNARTTGYLSGNSYYGNAYGNATAFGNSTTTITSTPPTPIPIRKPETTYVIRSTNRGGDGTYDAKALATEACGKKLKLDPRVAASLTVSETNSKP